MQDVIDDLRDIADVTAYPLEKPDFDDIVQAEEIILMPLPDEFKQFLMEVSDVIWGKYEPVTVADSVSHTYLPDVTAQAWNDGLPRELVPLCRYNDMIFAVQQDGEVALWQDGELDEHTWPSIWHWVDDVWIRDANF